MPSCIEVGEFFDDILEALVEAGLYASKAEAVRDALRRFIETLDTRLIGLRAYQRGATLWRALRVSGVGFDEFLAYLVSSGVAPELGCREVPPPPPDSLYVLDPVSIELLARLGVLERIADRVVLPAEVEGVVRSAEYIIGAFLDVRFESVTGYRSLARKLGVTLEEAAVLRLAAKQGLLVYCDPRLAGRAGAAGVKRIACCYSLLRLVDRSIWEPRFASLPIPAPRVKEG